VVNLLFPYAQLEAANVGGTRHLVEFCATEVRKELHFISTVSARLGARLDPTTLGYAGSKWSAERVVVAAREQGVPASIYRLPRIAGDARTARSNPRDAIMFLVSKFLAVGAAAQLDFQEPWISVDEVARAVVATGLQRPECGLFTLQPADQVSMARLVELLAARAELAILPMAEFLDYVAARFPDQRELLSGFLGAAVAPAQPDGPVVVEEEYQLVPTGGVSDGLLDRYVASLVQASDRR
jgi:thioester reductase-like protein